MACRAGGAINCSGEISADPSIDYRDGTIMARRTKCSSDKQLPLPLESLANPTHETALRMAYRRLKISRSLSLEQAMRDTAYAIGIRNLAEAMGRLTKDRRRY
jgi:hypothetical protein